MSDKNRLAKRKAPPGLVPGVTYSRGSMGDTKVTRAEAIPIANWFTVKHMNGVTNALLLIAGLIALCGGYAMARLIHFVLTIAYVVFFIVHIVQVIRAGWNNFRAMVTGVEVVEASVEMPAAMPVEPVNRFH